MISNDTKLTITITADEAQYILERIGNNIFNKRTKYSDINKSIRKKIRDAVIIANKGSDDPIHKLYDNFTSEIDGGPKE